MAKGPQKKKEVNDLYKLTKGLRDQIGMIWLTMVGYIVYLEFFKGGVQGVTLDQNLDQNMAGYNKSREL